jgi:hypothetical protein
MRAELAVRPLHVMDSQAFALSGVRVCIVEDGCTQVGLVDDLGVLHPYCFENFLASEDCMGALAIDVEGRDVEACLMAGILRVSGADAGVGCLVNENSTGRKWKEQRLALADREGATCRHNNICRSGRSEHD